MIALDPNGFNSDSSSATVVLKMVCEGLLQIDHSGDLAPALAHNWSASPDRSKFVFELDPTARFHSGRHCDAEAVAACFRRMLYPTTNSLLAYDYAGLTDIDVLSPTTVAFTFDRPNTSFLSNLAWRTHIVDDTQNQPVGTGPFVLTEWKRGEGLRLQRFAGDRTAQPGNVTTAEIRFAPQTEDRLDVVTRGEADIVESLPGVVARPLVERGLIRLQHAPSQQKATLCFNCRGAPFADPRLRLAVGHAIDRNKLAQTIGGPGSSVVEGLTFEDYLVDDNLEPLQFDPDKSRWLMAQAGQGGGFTIRTAATNVSPVPALVAAVAADLRNVGIELKATLYDDPPWWPYMYLRGPWDMAFQSSPRRPHPDTLFSRELRTGGPFNAGGYSRPDLDALIDEARMTIDHEQQNALYGHIQRMVREDLPVLVLFSSTVTVGWRDGITNFAPHPMGVVDIAEVNIEDSAS